MIKHGPTCPEIPVSRRRSRKRKEDGGGKPCLALYDPGIRTELVERVRREIAEGAYVTPEKLEIALERLFDRLSQA